MKAMSQQSTRTNSKAHNPKLDSNYTQQNGRSPASQRAVTSTLSSTTKSFEVGRGGGERGGAGKGT